MSILGTLGSIVGIGAGVAGIGSALFGGGGGGGGSSPPRPSPPPPPASYYTDRESLVWDPEKHAYIYRTGASHQAFRATQSTGATQAHSMQPALSLSSQDAAAPLADRLPTFAPTGLRPMPEHFVNLAEQQMPHADQMMLDREKAGVSAISEPAFFKELARRRAGIESFSGGDTARGLAYLYGVKR